jgi:hypothetical protein
MRFIPVFVTAAWLPHFEAGFRWLVLAAFVASLAWLLEGTKTDA